MLLQIGRYMYYGLLEICHSHASSAESLPESSFGIELVIRRDMDTRSKIVAMDKLAGYLQRAHQILVFTGAGIYAGWNGQGFGFRSSESGARPIGIRARFFQLADT